MIKLIFLCRRRSDISHDRYADLLLRGHAPLALRHHPTMRKYVVNIVERTPPGEEELDSIGELSFTTLADFHDRLYDSPSGRAVIEADVRGFMGGAHAYATTEYVQKDRLPRPRLATASGGVKLVCPLIRRADMTHDAFVEHWLNDHVPLALRHHPLLTKYVTNVVDQRLSSTGEAWDGFAELHLASAEDFPRLFDSAEGERIVREDIARFIGRTGAYWVREYVQKLP